jgi:hypothetical protein
MAWKIIGDRTGATQKVNRFGTLGRGIVKERPAGWGPM